MSANPYNVFDKNVQLIIHRWVYKNKCNDDVLLTFRKNKQEHFLSHLAHLVAFISTAYLSYIRYT